MIAVDRYVLVRAASLYVAALLTGGLWLLRRPSARSWIGVLLATLWNLPMLLMINVAAVQIGCWTFDATGGMLLGVPVDLWLSWAWIWALPALFSSAPISALAGGAFALDLVLMPLAAPVVRLEPPWLAGEAIALAAVLVPGQLLARWTIRDEHLSPRAVLQIVAFAGFVCFVVPAIAMEAPGTSSGGLFNPLDLSSWQLSLAFQLVAAPALLGLTAVQEFVTRGGGTPLPFDPPKRLVTSGIYAYIRNPMQLSGVLTLVMLGVVLRNIWVAGAGVMAHAYSLGLAGWDEDEDLRRRFGNAWTQYRAAVPRWVPRLRPWFPPDQPKPKLFVAASCTMCREVGAWFIRRGIEGVEIVPAEHHPSRALRRITYEAADATRAQGIEAVARALEHIHIGWALAGFCLRLPGVRQTAQIIADACGGEPRAINVAATTGHDR